MKPEAFRRILCLLLSCMIGGCAVDQDKEVERYRQVVDLEPAEYDHAHAVSLREALLLANENNENLAIEGEEYLRTIIQRRRSAASFMPTVDVLGTYRFRDDVQGASSSSSSSSNEESFDVSGDISWDLFRGFRNINSYWRDTFLIVTQRNDLLAQQELLLLDVAEVYYAVLRAESSVRVLESSLKVQEERLRDARGRQRAGTARPLDIAQSEAQVAATRTILISARRDVESARTLLALLTGASLREAELNDAFELPGSVESIQHYVMAASEQREDLLAASAAIDAAHRDVKVALGQYYPTVSINLSTFLYRETVPDERAWEGLLTASVPIFSAGRIRADVREAWSFYREALLVFSFLNRQVDQEVRDAYSNLAASEARIASVQAELTAAEQAFRQAEASYQVGIATNLDRVTAQDALLEAQLRLASEEYDRKVLYLSLLRATGILRESVTAMPASTQPATRSPATRPALQVDGFNLAPVTRTPEAPATRPAID